MDFELWPDGSGEQGAPALTYALTGRTGLLAISIKSRADGSLVEKVRLQVEDVEVLQGRP